MVLDKVLLVSKSWVQVKVVLGLFQFSLEFITILIHYKIVLSLYNWHCCNCLCWLWKSYFLWAWIWYLSDIIFHWVHINILLRLVLRNFAWKYILKILHWSIFSLRLDFKLLKLTSNRRFFRVLWDWFIHLHFFVFLVLVEVESTLHTTEWAIETTWCNSHSLGCNSTGWHIELILVQTFQSSFGTIDRCS